MIRELTNAGAKVALDDFGSGLSSLAHLKQLPVSYLKIDGAVRPAHRHRPDRRVDRLRHRARRAHARGSSTIAEHVETAAVAERLRELDVTLGQGFHFGRPQPFAETVRQAVRQAAAALPSVEAATRRIAVSPPASHPRAPARHL